MQESSMICFREWTDEYGFFSNDYPTSFTVGTLIFSSMTKYMMYCKASLFRDEETAWNIFREWDINLIRQYGKSIKNYNEAVWNGQRSIILARGLREKFRQNPDFIAELIRTGEEMLVFCDPKDTELGIGLRPDDPERLQMEQWKGLNLLGFALMDLRAVFQAQMPEGSMRAIRDKMGFDRKIGLMEALSGVGVRMREDECRYPPYIGEEPYIYLNYSQRDLSDAFRFVEFMNRLGFRVWYDDLITDGRMWTAERSDAIEKCFLVLDFDNGEEIVSHVRLLAREFAEVLEIPVVEFEMPTETEEIKALKDTFPELMKEAGLTPGMTWPDGEKQRKPQWDLVLSYYKSYTQKRLSSSWNEDWLWANLRTREVWDSRNHRVTGPVKPALLRGRFVEQPDEPVFLSDEEVYRSSVWKCRSFDAAPKNKEPVYIGTPKDWKFIARLARAGGGQIPEIRDEYRKAKDSLDRDAREYPYMDEFEYIDSRFED